VLVKLREEGQVLDGMPGKVNAIIRFSWFEERVNKKLKFVEIVAAAWGNGGQL